MIPEQTWNVVIVQPPGYVHSLAFFDIGRLLHGSLRSLGVPCTFSVNQFNPCAVNVVLGSNLLRDVQVVSSYPCILYQLEQLSEREGWFDATLLENLRRARAVWDYSRENIDFLQARGVAQARLVPIGFHESLRCIRPAEPDIDVLFYGSSNERRRHVLAALAKECRVETLFGVYQDERDSRIGRAKIILNVHYYAAQVLEQVRISYLLNNRCFVVSEESRDNPYAGGIVTAPYDQLVDTCLRYLALPAERERIAAAGFTLFEKNKMVDILRGVL
jgi:hypothetical protein